METHIEGPSGEIHITSEQTKISGPSGEIVINKGLSADQPLTEPTARKIVASSGGLFYLQKEGDDLYLIGPNGFRRKVGDNLTEEDICILNQHVPNIVQGGLSITGAGSEPAPIPGGQKSPDCGKAPDSGKAPAQ